MTEQDPSDEPAGAEKRRFRRVTVDLPGRLFLPTESREERCTVTDLSPGGAAVRSEMAPDIGMAVVLYVDGFGRFEGQVARRDGYGFGIAFLSTLAKRERTAEQLTLFLNKVVGDESILRRHERSGRKGFAKFTRADGQVVACEVMSISDGSVTLRTEIKPPVGEFVLIAQVAGRVVRHHETGIGIELVGQGAGEAMTQINLVR